MTNHNGPWFFATAVLVAALVGYSTTQYYEQEYLLTANRQLVAENKQLKNNLNDPLIRGIICVKPFKKLK